MSTDSDGRWKPPWGHNTPKNPDYLNNLYNDDDVLLIIEDTENSNILKETFPPKVFEGLPKAVPQIKSIRRLKTGQYEIKVSKKDRTDVLKIKTIKENIPVKISESRRNYSKATIYCDYINQYTDDDQLTKDLKNFNPNVIDAKIKKQFKDNKLTNTNIAILTLDQPTIPPNTKVKLFYQSLPVRVYYPDPQQCKVCFRFGHISTKNYQCPNRKMCGHCGQDSHVQLDSTGKRLQCENQVKCINCNDSHPAWIRQCPRYIKEKEIIKYHVDCKIPLQAARDAINKRKDPQPKPPTVQPTDIEKILSEKMENLTQQLTTQIKILCDLIVDNVVKPNMPLVSRKRPSEKGESPTTQQRLSPRPSAQGGKTVRPWYDQVEDMDHTPLNSLPLPDKLPPNLSPNPYHHYDPNVAKSGYVSDGAFYNSSRINHSSSQ